MFTSVELLFAVLLMNNINFCRDLVTNVKINTADYCKAFQKFISSSDSTQIA